MNQTVRTIAQKYIDYKKVFAEAARDRLKECTGRIVLNRKRTALTMDALDMICPYDGDFSPVFWEFAGKNVCVRAENKLTRQRMLIRFSSVEHLQSDWMQPDAWDSKLMRRGAIKL